MGGPEGGRAGTFRKALPLLLLVLQEVQAVAYLLPSAFHMSASQRQNPNQAPAGKGFRKR